MASTQLVTLKRTWRDACHTMWIQLLTLRFVEGHIQGNFRDIPPGIPLSTQCWCPESNGRVDDVSRDVYLQRLPDYLQYGITLRVVLLSAAFEEYFKGFLATYLASRSKYWDRTTSARTAAGDKVWGDVMKQRGPVKRIETFADLTGAGIKKVRPLLRTLGDVYMMRNIVAHSAGIVDAAAAAAIKCRTYVPGRPLTLDTGQLIELASSVLLLAELLDSKIAPQQAWVRP